MANNLVIVESPAKAKTIERFLGKDFKVASSYGHIADLPSNELGVDVEKDFSPKYIISSEKKKVVSELKSLVKKMKMVWLASDEDREGEAIAWHLANTLGLKSGSTKRIVFNEITKTAILDAIQNPREINYNLVNAQQARRVLDRLVGYEKNALHVLPLTSLVLAACRENRKPDNEKRRWIPWKQPRRKSQREFVAMLQ